MSKWNDDRGFGFISPAGGGAELFVHVSAFPRDGRRPTVGEVVSYETEAGTDGKARAVAIMRPGQASRPRAARRASDDTPSPKLIETAIAVVLIGIACTYGYSHFLKPAISPAPVTTTSIARRIIPVPAQCNGHTQCPQMQSCEEARHYLQICPNAQMDGDGDGVPCEEQWCNAD